jgi:hypothetical protein
MKRYLNSSLSQRLRHQYDRQYYIVVASVMMNCLSHRLSLNRPTKRGNEKSPSDGQCQCEKEMDDHLLACQQIFERLPRTDTPC